MCVCPMTSRPRWKGWRFAAASPCWDWRAAPALPRRIARAISKAMMRQPGSPSISADLTKSRWRIDNVSERVTRTPQAHDVKPRMMAITSGLARLGDRAAYTVRSSATAEDLPTASFAGQQDTYLNVVGPTAILQHVGRCWASLFTERAVTYRLRNGVDHRKVHMAVVVQQMVFPQAAGVLFTADPVTGNRKVASVEASFGLGEALVSGLVNADVYKVRDGEVVARTIAAKQRAVRARPAGGTQEVAVDPQRQEQPALTDAQVAAIDTEPGDAYYGYTGPGYVEEFWILDVEGTRLMIAAGRSPGAPSEDEAELRAILDSIRIEP